METIVLVAVALFCLAASLSWIRSAYHSYRYLRVTKAEEKEFETSSTIQLAKIGFQKAIHSAFLYASLGASSFILAFANNSIGKIFLVVVLIPAIISIYWATTTKREVSLTAERKEQEKRAAATLSQDQLAPRAWADRLAPEDLPDFEGLEVGKIYQAGSGLIAGDFYDFFRVSEHRLAAVIGDVAGKDIESSITAFQAKYLLRVFLREFRDPAQALEELNRQMSAYANEDFISIVVLLFDSEAGTLRYASAGHPTAWLWHNREVQPINTTGPVVMIDRDLGFYSREINVEDGDVVLMYTDGFSEVRNSSGKLFGEEKIGDLLRKDPNAATDVICKQILETAIAFSEGPVTDDMAMMAIRVTPGWTNKTSTKKY